MTHEFTMEDTEEHLRGLQASVDLINSLMESNDRSQENLDTMDRNVRHIGIMCAMEHLHSHDLESYKTAASAGSAWMHG